MTARRLAVVGVVIVVAFLAAVNVGVGRHNSGTRPGWVKSIRDVLSGSPSALTTAAFSGGDCVHGADLVVLGSCHLTIRPSSRPSREADLVLTNGASSHVRISQPGTLDTDVDLKPGEKERVSVFKNGGDLVVLCAGAVSCTVTLMKPQG